MWLGIDITGICFLYRGFGSRFIFAALKKRKHNSLLCAHCCVATVEKAQGMTHCPLSTSFTFLPPHLGSCRSPLHALAPPGLPRKATCLRASCAAKPLVFFPRPRAAALPRTPGALTACPAQSQLHIPSLGWIITFHVLSLELGCNSPLCRHIFPPRFAFLKNTVSLISCLGPAGHSEPPLDGFTHPDLSVPGSALCRGAGSRAVTSQPSLV